MTQKCSENKEKESDKNKYDGKNKKNRSSQCHHSEKGITFATSKGKMPE